MTRDEILKMEAGPELDLLIAQKVFGVKGNKIYWRNEDYDYTVNKPLNCYSDAFYKGGKDASL